MKKNFIEDILKITNSKVFCLGDLMLDKYVIGSTNRISPEGPIPILDVKARSSNVRRSWKCC